MPVWGLCVFSICTPAFGQEPPPSPGSVQDTLQEPPQPPVELHDIPAMEFPRADAPAIAPGGREVSVTRVVIDGNTVLPQSELDAFAQAYAGQSLTLAEIYAVADALTDLYRERGFGLAAATVPAQRVEDGTLRLTVVEGRIGSVRYEGGDRYDRDALARQAIAMQPGEVFRNANVDRALLLLNDLPGLRARAVVGPGVAAGTSDVVVRLEEDPTEFRISLDNYGRESIGEHRLTLDGAVNSPGGHGDVLSGSLLVSQSNLLTYFSLAYGAPIGKDGSHVGVSYSRADYDVGTAVFVPLDIEGLNNVLRIDWTHPTVRSRERTVVVGAAVSHTTSESTSLGTLTTDTEITLLEISAFMNRVWSGGSSTNFGVSFGTNMQSNSDGTDPGAQMGRLRMDASHTVWFAPAWAGVLRAAAVYSPDPLADTQKFSVGGPYSNRGFVSSEARGDRGASATAELQRHFRIGASPAYASAFFDTGSVRRISLPTDPPGLDNSTTLSSAGIGFTAAPSSQWRISAVWAKPVGSYTPADGDDGARVWAFVSAGF